MATNQKTFKSKSEAYDAIRQAVLYLEKQALVHQEWTLVSKMRYYLNKFKSEIAQIAINEKEN